MRYKGLLDELFGKPHLGRQYLYFRYKVQAKPNPRASINWPEIEAIWRNVERSLEEMHLCFDRDFHTTDEMEAHRRELAAQIDALCKERADCARLLRHKVPPPGTAERRIELTCQIKVLRHEDEVCDRILRRVRATTACRQALAEQARQRAEEKPATASVAAVWNAEPQPYQKPAPGSSRRGRFGRFVPQTRAYPCVDL